ncbi:MAG: hypothetical protein K8R89_00995, partial [Anaerolineae bacterium]|nr:hypothetical protein [Anaerolineae bacterium]
MQEKEKKSPNQFESPEWLRIILAYGVTIGGLFVLVWLATLFLRFRLIGLLLIIVVIPLFPAMQAILLRQKPASLFMKLYVAEFASLTLQLGLLLVSTPFIAISVAGVLACALLITAVIGWFIVGLQQLGLDIGSKMSRGDIEIFFWVTVGLIVAIGIFYIFVRLVRKNGDR